MTTAAPSGLPRFLVALLIVYVAKQLVVAFVSPPFTGHDEVAHFAMIRIVATEHRIPRLWTDRLPSDLYQYRAFSIEWRDRDNSPLYTAVHPPLYYLMMAPVYLAASHLSPEGIQYVLRCASIPWGVASIVLAFLLTTTLFPRDAFLGVTVPTAVAFQPQVSYEAAMVNNDALATALYTGILLLMVLTIRDGATIRRAALLGTAAGVALLAKGTTAIALVLIPLALLAGQRGWRWQSAAIQTAIAYGAALAIIGPWWWFMTRNYGDPMAFSAIAATQTDLTRHDTTFLQLLFSGRFLVDRWAETWGEFGWRLIHISPALMALLGVVAAACLAALGAVGIAERRTIASYGWRLPALVLLAAACALGYLSTVQFGVRFVLTQARYFFPMVAAAALLLMLGLRAWIPGRWHGVAQAVVVFTAIAVNVTIYTAYVLPYWYFR
jgi:4-amino-4-deoxy-L-arabinose transferase-like glycosyltransferase